MRKLRIEAVILTLAGLILPLSAYADWKFNCVTTQTKYCRNMCGSVNTVGNPCDRYRLEINSCNVAVTSGCTPFFGCSDYIYKDMDSVCGLFEHGTICLADPNNTAGDTSPCSFP